MKKPVKLIIIIVIITLALGGGIFAAIKIRQSNAKVKVMPVAMISSNYYGDALETSGQVSADNAQTVWLTKSHKIKEVLVKEGDEVKEGDVLIRFENKDQTEAIAQAELALESQKNAAHLDEIRMARVYATGAGPDWSKLEEKQIFKPCIETIYTEIEFGFTVARTVTDVDGNNQTFYPGDYGNFTESDLATIDGDSITQEEYDALPSPDATTKKYIKNVNTTASYLACTEYFIEDEKMGEQEYDRDGKITQLFDPDKRGYTRKQLDELIISFEKKCARNRIAIAKAELALQTMKEKQESGEVVAKVSGKVTKLQDINAINYNTAFLVVTSSEGYYVAGGIGEMYLDQFGEGSRVSCMNYNNGSFSEAVITEVEKFPTDSFYSYSEGNQNSSTYKFKAQMTNMEGFEIGDFLQVTFNTDGSYGESGENLGGNNIYIQKSFVRKDDNGYYVMIKGEDERLKKQRIITGKTVWGSMIEIKSGLTNDDYITFPYGDGAKAGAKCEITENMYNY